MEKKTIKLEDMKYEHLLGKKYIPGIQDCASLIRSFYLENFSIELTDYARPDNWWQNGLNLYYEIFADEGFKVVDVPLNKLQIGDILLMAFGSKFPNHGAIYVGNGRVIHHVYGKLSNDSPIGHEMRDALLAIIRRPDIIVEEPEYQTLNLEDFLSPYWKQRLANDAGARKHLDSLKSQGLSSGVPGE